jgi:hypothetical protein
MFASDHLLSSKCLDEACVLSLAAADQNTNMVFKSDRCAMQSLLKSKEWFLKDGKMGCTFAQSRKIA